MATPVDIQDSGYRSRKLWYAAGTSGSIVGLGILAAWKLPPLSPLLDTLVGGLLGALAIFCGANISNKWVAQKATASVQQPLKGQPVEQTPDMEEPADEPEPKT